MDRATTTEVEVDGEKYTIGRMELFYAIHLKNVIVANSLKQRAGMAAPEQQSAEVEEESEDPKKSAEGTVAMLWLMATIGLGDAECKRIQQKCLTVCRYYVNGSPDPLPVTLADGRITTPALQDNAPSIDNLITEVLKFNLYPFFFRAASKSLAKS